MTRRIINNFLILLLALCFVFGLKGLDLSAETIENERTTTASPYAPYQYQENNTEDKIVKDDVNIVTAKEVEELQETVISPRRSVNLGKEELAQKCNSDYGYQDIINNIKSDEMKALYEDIDEIETAFFKGNDNLNQESPYLTVSYDGNLSEDQITQTYNLYRHDHPLYYWMTSELLFPGNNTLGLACDTNYLSSSDREKADNKIAVAINEYADYCDGSTLNYTYASACLYMMAQMIDYAYDDSGAPESANWAHSIIGVFDEEYHEAVCEGYAKAYQLLMNYFDVPNVYVVGSASGNTTEGSELVLHAWNIVQMDDGGYYWVDPTWSDVDIRIDYGTYGEGDGHAIEKIHNFNNVYTPYKVRYTYFLNGNSFSDSHYPLTEMNSGSYYQYKLPDTSDAGFTPNISGIQPVEGISFVWDQPYDSSGRDLYVSDDLYTYVITQNDGLHRQVYMVWKRDGSDTELTIPASVEIEGISYTVTGVNLTCVTYNIKKATIEEGIKYLRSTINFDRSETDSITIPSSVEWIDETILSRVCLKEINIDSNNPYLTSKDGILYNKDMTTLLRYPVDKTDETFVLPNTVTCIYSYAFAWNKNLKNIELGNNVKYINVGAFSVMESLKDIDIPSSVGLLPRMVFCNSTSLEAVHISKNTGFTGETFAECSAIIDIEEGNPNGFTYDGAFYMNEGGSITLCSYPAGVSADTVRVMDNCYIKGGAFSHSGVIGKVIIPDNCMVDEASFMFSKVAALDISSNNPSIIYDNGAILSPDGKELWTYLGSCENESYYIPESVEKIKGQAFDGNEFIKHITMSDGVVDIYGYAFRNCSSLESIKLSDNINWNKDIGFDSSTGYDVYYSDIFSGCKNLKMIELPESTTHIPYNMFEGCTSLNKVIIPENVKTVGDCAFRTGAAIGELIVYSKDLKPADNTSWSRVLPVIPGASSFEGNSDNNYHGYDEDIVYIYAYHDSQIAQYLLDENRVDFYSGEPYTIVYRDIEQDPSNNPDNGKCGDNLVWSVSDNGKTLTITGTGKMYDYVLYNTCEAPWIWKYGNTIEHVIIEEGVTSIGEFSFYGMTSVNEIQFPDSLNSLAGFSFGNCDSLTNIEFFNDFSIIDNYAFAFCDNLSSAIFNGSVEEIGGCFIGCTSLEHVRFNEIVEKMSNFTFGGCISLEQLDLSNVQELNYKVCPACDSLQTIIVSEIKAIYDYAFAETTATIYYTAKVPEHIPNQNYGGNLQWILLPCTHEYSDWNITIEPTCTEEGSKEKVCSICGDIIHESIPAIGHIYGEWVVTKEATETEEGLETRTCQSNPDHVETRTIPKLDHTHKLSKVERKDATCTAEGNIEYYICSGCGRLFLDEEGTNEINAEDIVIEKNAHKYGDWTSKNEFEHQRVCEYDNTHIETASHIWDDGKISKEPTCTELGSKIFTCTVCGATHTEEIEAIGHKWSDWVITKEATETEEGLETRTCQSNPDHAEARTIPKLDHTHKLSKVEKKDATCTAEGSIEYYICSGCGKLFSDEEGTNEINAEDIVIEKNAHKYGDWTSKNEFEHQRVCEYDNTHIETASHIWDDGKISKEPTCTELGSKIFTCTVCGATHTEEIEAIGHKWSDWVITKEATETEEGLEARTCQNNPDHAEARTIPKLDHTHKLSKVEKKDATCTAEGSIEYYICSGCGRLFLDEEGTNEINAEDTIIKKNAHNPGEAVRENETAATCETAGSYEEVIRCSICGEELSRETKTIPITGHSFTNYVSNGDAACEKDGTKTAKCDHGCGMTDTIIDEGSALRHVTGEPKVDNKKEATCTENGSYDEITWCRVCNKELYRETKIIEATGHTAGASVIENEIAATYLADGSYDSVIYCSACGKELSRETITVPKLIAKTQTIKVSKASYSFIFNSSKAQSQAITVSGAKGTLSYISSKKAYVYGKEGKIYVARSAPVGTYTIKIAAAATEDGEYNASNEITATVKVSKAANTIKVTPATKKFKVAKLKKKVQSFQIKVTQAQGKVTYKSSNKKVKVTAKGKVTVKKGTKKGNYKITITAGGNGNYNKGVKTVLVVVK